VSEETIIAGLSGLIVGAVGTYGALTAYVRTIGMPGRAAARQSPTLHEWARRDVVGHAVTPPATNTRVRLVADEQAAARDTLTFHLFDYQAQQERDLTFRTAIVSRFMQCDTPCRAEWRGANGDYSLLLQIAKRYQWVYESDNGYIWSVAFATRERRARAIEAWAHA